MLKIYWAGKLALHSSGERAIIPARKDSGVDQITSVLADVRQQDYPLQISQEAAAAFVVCLRRIMDAVPDDDRFFVRADYDLVTSALCHPEGDFPHTNEQPRHYVRH